MQVREVICPSCSHRFMWMDVEEGPTIKKYRSVETGEIPCGSMPSVRETRDIVTGQDTRSVARNGR